MHRLIGFSVVALILVGCGGQSGSNRPATSPVTGVVTYKSKPVEGATVSFVATAKDGRGAMGTTDASGKFTLTTVPGPLVGAMLGTYIVTISKTSGGTVASTPAEAMAIMQSRGGIPKPTQKIDLLPTKYKDEKTSRLTAEVEKGGNEFTFDLTD